MTEIQDGIMNGLKPYISSVANGKTLNFDEARAAFSLIMSGAATPAQIGALLAALRVRGETMEEVSGAAMAMRANMKSVTISTADTIDIVGTGGDASGSYNISTCAAIVAAACGARVAKHGNKALSSKSGSADILQALGVKIDLPTDRIARCVDEARIGFMFAPAHHAAMKHVGAPRAELGIRTIFNLLGPLCNPAHVTRQLTGVFAAQWVEPIARSMRRLDIERAWVCHGDGLDEITNTGTTQVAELRNGRVSLFEITPEQVGLPRATRDQLKGGTPADNARAMRDVLSGARNAYRDATLMNTAAALMICDLAVDLTDGVKQAAAAIDSGAARQRLDHLISLSNE